MSRPALEVADVVRQHGADFLARYGYTLCGAQQRALRAIALCRTAALGGHITQCDHCAHEEQAYNSCRHRCCPKCHGPAQAAWLAARECELLNTPYVHGIFPLPHDLGPLALQNPRPLYGLLFHSVTQALQDIARDPKHLGAEIGGLAVLHTWGQQLHHHPHLHGVLPAGGLAPDGSRWVPWRPDFFLPVKVLSRRFRRLDLKGLERLYDQGRLRFEGCCRELAEPKPWKRLLAALRDIEWAVYAKEPVWDSAHILKYLARYTYRVALSNHRLVALQDGRVTFRYKDYKRGGELRIRTLDAIDCLRRLMLHVPPRGFQRIRHYGFLANRVRHEKLVQCRTFLRPATIPRAHEEVADPEAIEAPSGAPGSVCPVCRQGRMQLVQTLYRQQAAAYLSVPVSGWDTSERRLARPTLTTSETQGRCRLYRRSAPTTACKALLPLVSGKTGDRLMTMIGTCALCKSPLLRWKSLLSGS